MPIADYVFNTTADWDAWGGFKRVFSDVLRLAFNTSVDEVGATDTQFYYRPGTLGSLTNTPSDGRDATPNGTGVEFTESGVKSTNSTSWISPGGSPDDYNWLYDAVGSPGPIPPVPSGVINHMVFGGWFQWNLSSLGGGILNNVLFGFNFAYYRQDENFPSDGFLDHGVYGAISNTQDFSDPSVSYLNVEFIRNDATGFGDGSYFSMNAETTCVEGEWYHILVHIFFVKDSSNNVDVWMRAFQDGVMIWEELTNHIENLTTPLEIGPMSTFVPGILAASETNGGGATRVNTTFVSSSGMEEGWGSPHASGVYAGEGDEFLFSSTDPFGLATGSWSYGNNVPVFNVRRHPDPIIEGSSSVKFVTYSGVINTGHPSNSGIGQVRAYFDDETLWDNQSIEVSIRASTTSFAASDSTPAWSPWFDLGASNGSWASVGGGGTGPYVQVRLRLKPSADWKKSPEVTELDLWITDDAGGIGTQDLEGQVSIDNYTDLEGKVLIHQPGSQDLEGKLNIFYVGTPVNIEGQCDIRIGGDSVLEGQIDITLPSTIEGQVNIFYPVGSQDLEGQLDIFSQTGFTDLEGILFIKGSVVIEGEVTILVTTLEGQATIKVAGFKALEGQVNIPVDVPGPVQNLQSNIPRATWQGNTNAIFTWAPAAYLLSPVVGYYWILSRTPTVLPSLSWNTTTALTATLDLSDVQYGPGVWYFRIVARNALGYFGQVSTWEVRWDFPPSAPGSTFMRVNTLDTILASPLVPSASETAPQFTWTASTAFDPTATIVYEIAFAAQSDFGQNPSTGLSSILQSVQNIASTSYNWTNLLNPGRYFWRIRASDGREDSNWSRVGSFVLNSPPRAPTSFVVLELD